MSIKSFFVIVVGTGFVTWSSNFDLVELYFWFPPAFAGYTLLFLWKDMP